MKLWVDADSCPARIREILVRASERERIPCTFVANRKIPIGRAHYSRLIVVERGPESADERILAEVTNTDLVITRDTLLAMHLLELGCEVINPRGDLFTRDEIRERVSIRNTMKSMREAGLAHDGDRTFGKKEVYAFANTLDTIIRRAKNRTISN